MKMADCYLYTQKLTVGYGGVPLIRDIQIEIKKGEIVTLIGPNGAGKTTILRSMIRQLPPVCGVVWLDGRQIGQMTGKEMAQRLSVVLTERVDPELMNCEDVVATGRYPYTGRFGVLSQKDWEIVRESMEMVHISELRDRDFNKISDGQKQRVMLARALCQQPDVIVLDEPTSFLDIRYKLEFLSILQDMSRKRNLTVLMSLHELDLAGRISDKIACVRGDRIDRFGPPEEIFTKGYIPELYQMTTGSYDELTGNLELTPASGPPQIFVIAGNGTGTGTFRRLQRQGKAFAAGILWENDADYAAARALASEVISVPAFRRITNEQLEMAMHWIDRCEAVICTLGTQDMVDFAGTLNELVRYAVNQGKPTQEGGRWK